ncbi:MAG TPA: MarR family transcriptional regulator [Ktedonobacterales bacterium]|nr:MarR family transcriptional regulator [Ktedonobacterales bacterium]
MSSSPTPEQESVSTTDADSPLDLTKQEFERLAALRHALRRFVWQTELEARKAGLSPQQYQLLLAIKGFPGREWANISELAERMQIRHNAIIGLVNRGEANGLVRRAQEADQADRRIVRVHLTEEGERVLRSLAQALQAERQRLRRVVLELDHELAGDAGD